MATPTLSQNSTIEQTTVREIVGDCMDKVVFLELVFERFSEDITELHLTHCDGLKSILGTISSQLLQVVEYMDGGEVSNE